MANKRGRPPGVDAKDTRRRLVDVAFRKFSENGYSQTAIKDVAAEADMTTGAIYYYFASKVELYSAAALEGIRRYDALVHERSASLAGLPRWQRLEAMTNLIAFDVEIEFHLFFMDLEIESRRDTAVAEVWDAISKEASDVRERIVAESGGEMAPIMALMEVVGLGVARMMVRDRDRGVENARCAIAALHEALGVTPLTGSSSD